MCEKRRGGEGLEDRHKKDAAPLKGPKFKPCEVLSTGLYLFCFPFTALLCKHWTMDMSLKPCTCTSPHLHVHGLPIVVSLTPKLKAQRPSQWGSQFYHARHGQSKTQRKGVVREYCSTTGSTVKNTKELFASIVAPQAAQSKIQRKGIDREHCSTTGSTIKNTRGLEARHNFSQYPGRCLSQVHVHHNGSKQVLTRSSQISKQWKRLGLSQRNKYKCEPAVVSATDKGQCQCPYTEHSKYEEGRRGSKLRRVDAGKQMRG
eukprot:scaffold65239_cov19-Tisochrysis_lutea.AAC.3